MSSGMILVLAIALLMAGGAIALWSMASQRQQHNAARRHLRTQVSLSAAPAAFVPRANSSQNPLAQPVTVARWRMPGWLLGVVTPKVLLLGLAILAVATILALLAGGWLSATAMLLMVLLGEVFFTWLRVQKVRRGIVHQLPGFLDTIVRLIAVGHSTQSAFQSAVAASKAPLCQHMENTLALCKAGMDLEEAMLHEAQRSRIDEMLLIASVLGMGVRYGGRSDQLLERVAHFMRDSEEANQELSALSSETRLSAWILGLLPIGVGGAIMMSNPDYFIRMWSDPTGQRMVIGAALLQLTGVALMYRLARLD